MPWSKVKPEFDEPREYWSPDQGDRQVTYVEAVREAVEQALDLDPRVFVMGQGVDDPSGMFGTTKQMHLKYGTDRVFDTPLAENGLTGIATGAALGGLRPLYFHNRPDFLLLAMDQLVNHAAKWSYMFAGSVHVPLTLWACIGRGWGSAAQHSQALQGLFMHVPGLIVIMPSTCYDAKGLILSGIANDNPVLILEHRFNFKQKGFVPEDPYLVPIGKAVIRRCGRDVTIVTASMMVSEAYRAAEELAQEGIEAEIVDIRTLRPLDEQTILDSVARTRRLVVADCGWKTGGITAEISAMVAEKGLQSLDAPIKRVACPDLPTPSGYTLENAFYVGKEDILQAVKDVLK